LSSPAAVALVVRSVVVILAAAAVALVDVLPDP
jgi:hypothetical protein